MVFLILMFFVLVIVRCFVMGVKGIINIIIMKEEKSIIDFVFGSLIK